MYEESGYARDTRFTMYITMTDEEFEFLGRFKKPEVFSLTPNQLAEEFPEAKTFVKRRLKEINKELSLLSGEEIKMQNWVRGRVKVVQQQNVIDFNTALFFQPKREDLKKDQERLSRILMFMEPKTSGASHRFTERLALAREFPIPKLIAFNGAGFAKCIWHDEKSGSMKYYRKQNKVYCFGCRYGGDAIDVMMRLQGLTLSGAVDALTGTVTHERA